MSESTKILVDSEKDFVRRIIDVINVYYPLPQRISGVEYDLFEALIWANQKFGTINSSSVESFVKEFIERPKMTRKLYTKYRRNLARKGWLLLEEERYYLYGVFSVENNEYLFNKAGLKKAVTIPLMVIRT